jgi:circadian clock protein KaiC
VDQVVPTGIWGLDLLISGGIRRNTVSVIVGGSGTGKTIFSLQFLLKGLHDGDIGIYLTMEETPKQLMKEAKLIGFYELESFVDENKLLFIHCTTSNFKDFIVNSLPEILERYQRRLDNKRIRIAIDSLTPVIWACKDKVTQRNLIYLLFYQMKNIGSVVATVEEHSDLKMKELRDVSIPVFLADYAFLIQYIGLGDEYDRALRVLKTRGSDHISGAFPVVIVDGWGIVIVTPPRKPVKTKEILHAFQYAQEVLSQWDGKEKEIFKKRFEFLQRTWNRSKSPAEVIELILRSNRLI